MLRRRCTPLSDLCVDNGFPVWDQYGNSCNAAPLRLVTGAGSRATTLVWIESDLKIDTNRERPSKFLPQRVVNIVRIVMRLAQRLASTHAQKTANLQYRRHSNNIVLRLWLSRQNPGPWGCLRQCRDYFLRPSFNQHAVTETQRSFGVRGNAGAEARDPSVVSPRLLRTALLMKRLDAAGAGLMSLIPGYPRGVRKFGEESSSSRSHLQVFVLEFLGRHSRGTSYQSIGGMSG